MLKCRNCLQLTLALNNLVHVLSKSAIAEFVQCSGAIRDALKESPSLKPYLKEVFAGFEALLF